MTRSEKFAQMDKERENICDHSQEAKDYFQKQADIWNNEQAASVANRASRQGKDWK